MLIYAVSMDKQIVSIGFRRVVSCAKHAGFDVQSIYFLEDENKYSHAGSWWKQNTGENFAVNERHNEEALLGLAETLALADVVAFSLMSVQRNIVRKLSAYIKERNPGTKIIIGGYHPTLFPDDAISFADVICLGEGERTFVDFLERVQRGDDLKGLPNTWVREYGEVIVNPRQPLLTKAEMETIPFMEYGVQDQFFFSYQHGVLRKMVPADISRHLGTTYNTIWSVGCPYKCSFCSQATLIELDRDYACYRGPSPEYIVNEVMAVQSQFPLDYVIFYDANFIGRGLDELKEFSRLFRKTGLKFILGGTNPASITEEKMQTLVEGGLVRIKMGFESANDEILRLFNRPVNTVQLRRATEILALFGDRMAAPAFETIVDNPYETTEQLYKTIDFLQETPPPFTLSLFSLQFMPGTALSMAAPSYSLVEEQMEKDYLFSYKPTAINNLVSIFAVFRPPAFMMSILRRLVRGREERQYPRLKTFLYKLMLVRRGINQARFGDYSTFPCQVMVLYHRYRIIMTKLMGN